MLTAVVMVAASVAPVEARGAHGGGHFHHGLGGGYAVRGGGSLVADRHHANDTYVTAASKDLDKGLDTKIKSICRGC